MAHERYSKRPVGKLVSAHIETETGTRLTKPECTLFTSIPPRLTRLVQGRDFGLAWQTACIKSWRDAGFRIVSLNTPKEIEALRSLEPEVEFVEIGPDRTRPLITDFFAAAENSRSRIAGIINADCMIIPQTGIINHFTDNIGGIVIAHRINISQETLFPTGVGGGFDAFFFDVSTLAHIEHDNSWRIGEVWYDFWLPLAFHVAGFKIKTLPAPILLHLNHDFAWDSRAYAREFPRLINLLRAHNGARLDPVLMAELSRVRKLHANDVAAHKTLLFYWLKSREKLWTPEAGSAEDFMMRFLNAFGTPSLTRYERLKKQIRARLRQMIDALGLRRTLYMLGLVRQPSVD